MPTSASRAAPALEAAAGLADSIIVNNQLDTSPCPTCGLLAFGLTVKSGKPILAVSETAAGFSAGGKTLVAWMARAKPPTR